MSNFIIKKGDKLKVRSDLNLRPDLNLIQEVPYGLNDSMIELAGQTVTVNLASDDTDRFFININDWTWHRYMVEEIIEGTKNEQEIEETRDYTEFKIGDIVRIRKASELKEIYGEDELGIKTYIPFVKRMERMCGLKATVTSTFGKFVTLRFAHSNRKVRDEHGNEWSYSTDMIEIYKEKERKSAKMEKVENQDIINEMISKVDVKKFKKILASSFEMPATKLKGVDRILQNWASAKKDLYVLLGNNLKVTKNIEYIVDAEFWKEQITQLKKQFPGIGYMLNDIPLHCFVRNKYEYFCPYFEKEVGIKEGTKLTTVLSNLFGNQDFDTAFSKVIDQAKVTGNIVISIDPVDFLTMSFNQSGWCSCHTISHGGASHDFGEFVRRYF